MVAYNLTNVSMLGILHYTSTVTQGWFWVAVLFVLYVLAFLLVYRGDFAEALIPSSFIMLVLSGLLYFVDPVDPLVPQKFIWFFVLVLGLAVLYSKAANR